MALVDRRGELLFVNRAFAAMLGFEPLELIGKKCPLAHPFDQVPAIEAAISRTPQAGDFLGELSFSAKDGSLIAALVHSSALTDEDGCPLGTLLAVRDLSELKETAEKMHQSYRAQRALSLILQSSLFSGSLRQRLKKALELILSAGLPDILPWGGIYVTDEETGELVLEAGQGLPPSVQKNCARILPGQCFCGEAASSGKLRYASADAPERRGDPPGSHCSVPIKTAGEVLGVLLLFMREGHKPDEADKIFMDTAASILGLVIKYTRLEGRIEKSAPLGSSKPQGVNSKY